MARLARLWRDFWNMLERMRPQLTYEYGKAWYRPYDSLEKRWVADAPHISDTDVERLVEVERRDRWAKPSFPEIAKKEAFGDMH